MVNSLLSDVYLNLTGGQVKLNLSTNDEFTSQNDNAISKSKNFKVVQAAVSSDDLDAHHKFLEKLSQKSGEKIKW